MANIKSAIKRIDITKRQTALNKARKSEIKTYIKKFDKAIEVGNIEEAEALFKLVDKRLKQAQAKNIIHRNAVARTSSKLAKKLNQAKA